MTDANLEREKIEIARKYKEMLSETYRTLSDKDKVLIRRSFDLAAEAHKDQRRKSGEPYIFHPIAVAHIVANEIGLGAVSIASALLHDVVEDTEYTLDDIEHLFGKKIAKIIDGLTKISVLNNQDLSIQSENFKKLLLTLSEDIRVILIKIADRLHNMRTLDAVPEKKQLKIASETIFIYAPLAHRMGLYNIKSELEDLSLKFTNPDAFYAIQQKLEEDEKGRIEYINNFTSLISDRLEEEQLSYEIKGRSKSIHSIHKKMESKDIPYEEVFDKFAIRVIYDSDKKNEKFIAWKIYSIITDIFNPNPTRLRDWITQPKSTGYESLHTTVMGPGGKWVEVQIRSARMNEIAEKGIAAHYKYKDNYKVEDSQVDKWIKQMRDVLDNNDAQNTAEFIDNFKMNLYAKEIYVFTPQGDLISLPVGACSLDFAYAIHTNIGSTCLGAKVNGKLKPLSHQLETGDQVEIITSSTQHPKTNWLDFVKTARAKAKIRASLNAEKRELANEGKEVLIRKLKQLKRSFDENTLNELTSFFNEKTSQDLFIHVKNGILSSNDIKKFTEKDSTVNTILNRFRPKPGTKNIQLAKPNQKLDSLVFGADEKHLDYTLANCCNPIAGDKVFGFVTVNRGINVHKMSCPNAVEYRANYAYRILEATWIDSSQEEFDTKVTLNGIDRKGLVKTISDIITTDMGAEMTGINFSSKDGVFNGEVTLRVENHSQLKVIMEHLNKIKEISSVKRAN